MVTTEPPGVTDVERVVDPPGDDRPLHAVRDAEAPRWRSSEGLAAIGIPSAVVAFHAWLYGQWIEDDSGITFAYARSIASGAGPVLQAGAAPVEGYSNPAWLAIMVIGRLLGLFDHGSWFGTPDLVLFPKLVGLVCCVGIFAAFYSVARLVTDRPATVTVVAGCLTALVPSFTIWVVSGLENGLLALAVVGIAATLVRGVVTGRLVEPRTAVVCGLLAALAALTRPDGLIYVAAFPLAVGFVTGRTGVRTGLRVAALSVGAFLVPTGLYLIWRLLTFGDWLPNTARAKAQGLPGVDAVQRPVQLIGYAGWLSVGVVVVMVAAVFIRRSPVRTVLGMLLIPLGLAVACFAVLAPDWMPQYRFTTPVWPLLALIAAIAGVHLFTEIGLARRRLGAFAVIAAVLLAGVPWGVQIAQYRQQPTAPMCYVAMAVGRTIDGYADQLGIAQGSLAAIDGGGTSLSTRLRFLDLAGLADKDIADYWQRRDVVGLVNHVFDVERPTFIQLSPAWGQTTLVLMSTDPRMARDYALVSSSDRLSGTWVRRDAVSDPARLDATRQWAQGAALRMQQAFEPDHTRWVCGPTLSVDRPGQAISGLRPVG